MNLLKVLVKKSFEEKTQAWRCYITLVGNVFELFVSGFKMFLKQEVIYYYMTGMV